MKFTVKYAPPIDREKLRVRINEKDKPANIEWYDYVRIKVRRKTIVCKLHGDRIPEIEPKGGKTSLIYINEPLRYKLRVEVGDNLDFEIKKKPKWLAWCYFIRYHPDDIVRVSTWLAIFALALGVLAVVLTVIDCI